MKIIAIIIFAVATVAYGQTAKVIPLSSEDTAKAIKLRADLKAAQDAVEKFDKDIQNRYVSDAKEEDESKCSWTYFTNGQLLTVGGGVPTCETEEQKAKEAAQAKKDEESYRAQCIRKVTKWHPREGWTDGFTYSEDFKFIVPNPPPAYKPNPMIGGMFVSPAGTAVTQ